MALKAPVHQFTQTQSIQITRRDFFYVSNILSAARLVTVPFIFLTIYREQWILAMVWGGFAVITDVLDGFLCSPIKATQRTRLYLRPYRRQTRNLGWYFRTRSIKINVSALGIPYHCHQRCPHRTRQRSLGI